MPIASVNAIKNVLMKCTALNKKIFARTPVPAMKPDYQPEAGEKLPEREIFHKGFFVVVVQFEQELLFRREHAC